MVVEIAKQIRPVNEPYPEKFLTLVDRMTLEETQRKAVEAFLWQAYQTAEQAHSGQVRQSGKPYFEHCYNVALLLSEWRMDPITVAAGMVHDCIEDTEGTPDERTELFGPEITHLVEGVTKLAGIKFRTQAEKQAENYMKMLLSVAKDIRVILIKFADRLHNMRTIQYLPQIKQRRIALETRDVYAPLAHRLGMARVKWELEDLVLKTLEPEASSDIEKKVRDSRADREKYIEEYSSPIRELLDANRIHAKIIGRPKHYYSIWGKMQRRRVSFEEIYDLLAIRIIVDRLDECYATLGIIHQLYTPVQERFKDFVATPKLNGYQSIHTTVVGPQGKVVEVQIRTQEMDQTAEIGVAAHWRYKEDPPGNASSMDRHIRWLRELVEVVQDEKASPEEFLDLLKIDLFKDEIFIFTPKGDLIQLPVGATPIDMAFEVHTEVGLHCVGARVNGKIVPLNTVLKNGDTVEVITSEHQTPSHAWLKFVQTSKAKTHIRKHIRRAQQEESIRLGHEVMDKALRRLKRTSLKKDLHKQPQKAGFDTEDGLYAALGRGDATVRQIIEKYIPDLEQDSEVLDKELIQPPKRRSRRSAQGVRVDGISDLLISLGKCCSPIPGDEIIGFVTRGRGITVHRVTCENLPMIGGDQDRYIEVHWDVERGRHFVVSLKIVAEDRKHFLKDVTESISKLNTNIVSVDLSVEEGILTCYMTVEVDGIRKLQRIQNRLKMIQGIIYMERE
jgi:GTP pyrophosphokinase